MGPYFFYWGPDGGLQGCSLALGSSSRIAYINSKAARRASSHPFIEGCSSILALYRIVAGSSSIMTSNGSSWVPLGIECLLVSGRAQLRLGELVVVVLPGPRGIGSGRANNCAKEPEVESLEVLGGDRPVGSPLS